jgi:hypothetical protein
VHEPPATGVAGVLLSEHVVAVKLLAELATAPVQAATAVGPVLTGVHVVRTKVLPATGFAAMQVATAAGPLSVALVQAVVVKLLPEFGVAAGLQVATGVGPVAKGAGQVRVNQLGDVGDCAVHVATGTLVVVGLVQIVVTPPTVVDPTVHDATRTTAVGSSGHVVVVNPLAAVAAWGVQVATGVVLTVVGAQVVAVQLLPLAAAIGAQAATSVGPVALVEQVVVV